MKWLSEDEETEDLDDETRQTLQPELLQSILSSFDSN